MKKRTIALIENMDANIKVLRVRAIELDQAISEIKSMIADVRAEMLARELKDKGVQE